MKISAHGCFTEVVESGEELSLPDESVFIRGGLLEERHEIRCNGGRVVTLQPDEEGSCVSVVENGKQLDTISLRQHSALDRMLEGVGGEKIVLDITTLATNVWFPILRRSLKRSESVYAFYSEPKDYNKDAESFGGNVYDLSERIRGIKPIPGAATLSSEFDEDFLFIPILGFEGARFAHIVENVQPQKDSTVPLVGLPGFRAEYPTKTLISNRSALLDTGGYREIRYASANCPFSVFEEIHEIYEDYSPTYVKIAPIGTKPAALGAALYYLSRSVQIELVFDHPVKKSGRTEGLKTSYLYDLSSYLA